MAPKVTPKKVALKKPVIHRTSQAASKKPIISLGTLITLVIFAGIILGIILINRQKESSAAEATPTAGAAITFVFAENSGLLSSIEVKPDSGEAIKLARDEKKAWAFELPAKAEADQGLVEAAASQVSALQIVDSLPADADPSVFGFDSPAYTLAFDFAGKTRTLEVGDATPTNSGYYVRVDGGKIVIVGLSGIDAITNLVVAPPYVSTPVPEAAPVEATSAPEISITPTP